jgi:hypothetical protein
MSLILSPLLPESGSMGARRDQVLRVLGADFVRERASEPAPDPNAPVSRYRSRHPNHKNTTERLKAARLYQREYRLRKRAAAAGRRQEP